MPTFRNKVLDSTEHRMKMQDIRWVGKGDFEFQKDTDIYDWGGNKGRLKGSSSFQKQL